MNDPKLSDQFDSDFDELRPSHDMLETAREIRVSPEEQEEAVAREEQRRQEQAARLLYEQAAVAFEAAAKGRQRARRAVAVHALLFIVGSASLSAINQVAGGGLWVQWPLLAWLLGLAAHAGWVFSRPALVLPTPPPPSQLSAMDTPRPISLQIPSRRPLAGQGREEDADERLQSRARETQRTNRRRD
jgi:2TM domain